MGSKIDGPSGPRQRFFHSWTFIFSVVLAIIHGKHAKLTFLKKWEVINLMSYLGLLWSLDHPQTNSVPLLPFHSYYIQQTKRSQIALLWTDSGHQSASICDFLKILPFTENAGEHRSKGIDDIRGVQNWWSEWSQINDFSYLDLVIFSVVLAIIHG